MRTFELNIFINRPRREAYEHLAEPINMIGLHPFLTTIDVLKEQKDADGVTLRPFHTVEVFRWLGLPVLRERVYSVVHLTKPGSELEIHVFRRFGTRIVFGYILQETEEGYTHLNQGVRFEHVNKLVENFVFNQAIQTQRTLLASLKARLEK
jgi:hypothetical protein